MSQYKIKAGDWKGIESAFNRLMHQVLGPGGIVVTGDVDTDTINVSTLTASRLLGSDASRDLVSVANLASWIAGTSNRVTVTNDGDGTVTLSGPQDIHSGASPTFAGLTLTGLSGVLKATTGVISGSAAHSDLASIDTNQHVDHTAVSVTAGTGMSGGGTIAANRTLTCTITQYTDALARAAVSSSATGLTYTSSTGVLSLTSGYVIPTTTEESNWNAAAGASHAAITLATSADVLLGLTGQQLSLDTQVAARILAGPATGEPAAPTFRALVSTDIPALAYEASGAVSSHAALLTGIHGLAITAGQTLTVTAGGTLGSAAYTASTAYEVPITFSTGLNRTTNTVTCTITQYTDTLARAAALTLTGTLTLTGNMDLSLTNTVAGGAVACSVDAIQDTNALTGTLRGIYSTVTNGAFASSGTIRAIEGKARAATSGLVGGNVGTLEGMSLTADAKDKTVITLRGAEIIMDGQSGAAVTTATGLRISNNFQAAVATTSYGLHIYRDSFDYTADILLSKGGTISGDSYLDQDCSTSGSPAFTGLTLGSLTGILKATTGVVSVYDDAMIYNLDGGFATATYGGIPSSPIDGGTA